MNRITEKRWSLASKVSFVVGALTFACGTSFILALCGILPGVPYGIGGLLLSIPLLFILSMLEGQVEGEMWDRRRARWLDGGYDPAYPDSDSERKRCRPIEWESPSHDGSRER